MSTKDDEEQLLRSVAEQNAQSITLARRRDEESLREQSDWLRVTLASIGDAVISTDVEGRVTLVNRVAESLTGWSQADALGRSLTEIFQIVNEESRQPVRNVVKHEHGSQNFTLLAPNWGGEVVDGPFFAVFRN